MILKFCLLSEGNERTDISIPEVLARRLNHCRKTANKADKALADIYPEVGSVDWSILVITPIIFKIAV